MKRRERFKRKIHSQSKSNFKIFNLLKKINIFKYLSIFLIILFLLSIPSIIKKLIKINKIECITQFGPCDQEFQLGDYRFVKDQIEKGLKKNIQVNSYIIQYKIPSTIRIEINLKKPKYAIKDLVNRIYLIDKEGVILKISKESNLPILVNDVTYVVGQKISDKDMFALTLLEKVGIINIVTTAEVKKETLEVKIDNMILVKFPIEGDIDVLAGSLRLIFSRLNEQAQGIRMENVHEIDLRFKNTVLR